jgi:cold-inducible RNA-binding protein
MATRIYVGNLPYSATNETLAQLFSTFGEVTEASVVIDRESGRSKGFGFIQMASESAAHSAISSLDRTALDDRTINVAEARPRAERATDSRSGGGYSRNNNW